MIDTTDTTDRDTEEQLIEKAQVAVSRCNWIVGFCAARWTTKYARGRTDADFGEMVGLSGDQVYQRRRVWEAFGDAHGEYERLKWSHFYVALNWEDATECLQWADENEATVAEMRAWRRAQLGEDLSAEATAGNPWGGDSEVSFLPTQPVAVREPGATQRDQRVGEREDMAETKRNGAREGRETQYAPFRADAGKPPSNPDEAETSVLEKPRRSSEELLKRMISTLERVDRAFTPALIEECRELPRELRQRFSRVVGQLRSKAAVLD